MAGHTVTGFEKWMGGCLESPTLLVMVPPVKISHFALDRCSTRGVLRVLTFSLRRLTGFISQDGVLL